MRGAPLRSARSLSGQMALLLALALFVAQALNFALLLRERRTLRLAQVTGPAVARLADAFERRDADPEEGRRSRVRRSATDPAAALLPREPQVEAAVLAGLREAGAPVRSVSAVLRPLDPRNPIFHRRGPPPPDLDAEVVIAARQPDGLWLVTRLPWWGGEAALVWRLAGQTLILYAAMLLPLLWVARRIAAPLRDLTAAAERFSPADGAEPVAERGPPDVTALIAAFNRLRARVTAMLDEKDRMLGAIGHDLRTPLAALRVRLEAIGDEPDRHRAAELVEEMDRTLDDILSLARLGRPGEAATEVDLAALADAVVEDFRDLGEDVTFIDHPRLALRLRPTMVRRAVRNLVENAVKYAGAAEVRVADQGHAAQIVVADRGPGIPPDRLDAVLEPFTRLEASRNRDTGGIGLGLALARAVAREAGGDLRLANRQGGGLEATLTLPR